MNASITRISQCLMAAALIVGTAIGAAAFAGAEPQKYDQDAYLKCLADLGPVPTNEPADQNIAFCCWIARGVVYTTRLGTSGCAAPPSTGEADPGPSGPTQEPPVLDPGPIAPNNPVIPDPRAPNSGTIG
jgi:hypothetical protein